MCHPGYQTKCLRGTMAAAGLTCQDCHGSMRDVGNPARRPWTDLPRCGNCHASQYAENPGQLYRNSKGHGGLYCEACHGSPHAILPSTEANDNIQNIGLQGSPGVLRDCTVCHNPVPAGPGPHGVVVTPPATPATPTPVPSATATSVPATPTPVSTPGTGARMFLDPSLARGAVGGSDIAVQVRVENVNNLGGFQFTLTYDPNIVHVSNITVGDFPGSSGRTVSPLPVQIDNTAGRATFGAFTYGSAPGASGAGVLADITLAPQEAGESALALVNVQVTDTNAQLIPVTVTGGQVSISQCPAYDLDCDGDVDIIDVMQVATHWRCQQGDACYAPRYDLDGDGDVDIVDIMQVAAHWNCKRGDTCYSSGVNMREASLQGDGGQFRLGPAEPTGEDSEWRVPLYVVAPTPLDAAEFTLALDPVREKVVNVRPGTLLLKGDKEPIMLPVRMNERARTAEVGFVTYGAGRSVTARGHLLDIIVRSEERPRLHLTSTRTLHLSGPQR